MKKQKEEKKFVWAYIITVAVAVFLSYVIAMGITTKALKTPLNEMEWLKQRYGELQQSNGILQSEINKIKVTAIPFEDIYLSEDYSWDCIDWYADCGNVVYDNQTGFFIQKGFIDPSCENACKTKTLHYFPPLPSIRITDEGVEVQFANGSKIKDMRKCCYPSECQESKNNPENCDCIYPVACGLT